jgi:hypothetical protein
MQSQNPHLETLQPGLYRKERWNIQKKVINRKLNSLRNLKVKFLKGAQAMVPGGTLTRDKIKNKRKRN